MTQKDGAAHCSHRARFAVAFGMTLRQRRAAAAETLPFHQWVLRPPMGWNSWDNFATTITEQQTKAQADYIAAASKRSALIFTSWRRRHA